MFESFEPKKKSCCTPKRDAGDRVPVASRGFLRSPDSGSADGMVRLDGGSFLMGYEGVHARPEDGEGPVREVTLAPFFLDKTTVTNEQFASFIEATGYVTESERFNFAHVFIGQLSNSKQRKLRDTQTVQGLQWWYAVDGACWKKPEGAGSTIKKRMDHPVVCVSWNDAVAYADWAGKRLPTEAEWEYAARGDCKQAIFPWGDELEPKGKHRCNVWQGDFPLRNTAADGYAWTAPARSFRRSDWGFYNQIGNVWEWCADWFSPNWHATATEETRLNPSGPSTGDTRVMKGGSFLCHESYCNRYRLSGRTANTPDSATTNLGFRCAMDA